MDTLISVSFGTKIHTAILGVEIHMNTDKFIWVGISEVVHGEFNLQGGSLETGVTHSTNHLGLFT